MNFRHLLLIPVLAIALALVSASPTQANMPARFAADQDAGNAWLGVYLQPVTRDIAESMDLEEARGALISEVVTGSPAEDAGLRHGDVILSINNDEVANPDDVIKLVQRHEVGDRLRFGYVRDGRRDEAFVTLAERPSQMENRGSYPSESAPMPPSPPERGYGGYGNYGYGTRSGPPSAYLGVRVVDLNDDLGHYFHKKQGALVVDVGDDTPAKRAGLKAGDVITAVNGRRVDNSGDLVDAIQNAGTDRRVDIEFVRRNETRRVDATLSQAPSRFMEMNPPRGRMRAYREPSPNASREELRQQIEDLQREVDNLRQQIDELQRNQNNQ